jgi:hypothetical protein
MISTRRMSINGVTLISAPPPPPIAIAKLLVETSLFQ